MNKEVMYTEKIVNYLEKLYSRINEVFDKNKYCAYRFKLSAFLDRETGKEIIYSQIVRKPDKTIPGLNYQPVPLFINISDILNTEDDFSANIILNNGPLTDYNDLCCKAGLEIEWHDVKTMFRCDSINENRKIILLLKFEIIKKGN